MERVSVSVTKAMLLGCYGKDSGCGLHCHSHAHTLRHREAALLLLRSWSRRIVGMSDAGHKVVLTTSSSELVAVDLTADQRNSLSRRCTNGHPNGHCRRPVSRFPCRRWDCPPGEELSQLALRLAHAVGYDHAWRVATEIDFDSTYLGASEACGTA